MSLLDKASLIVTPNAYKESKLYSVVPNTTLGDMDVVRATTATRVNSAGLIEEVPRNLFTFSEQFNDVSWVGVGATVIANAGVSPNGTLTADRLTATSNLGALLKSSNQTIQVYTQSIWVKSEIGTVSGSLLGISSSATKTDFIATTEWKRVTNTVLSLGGTRNPQIRLDLSGTSILIWGAQLEAFPTATEYFPTTTRLNIPRIDYTNGSCPSLLVEPQRTNLLTYSNDFSNVSWVKQELTLTANSIISPDGTLNAYKLTPTAVNSPHQLNKLSISASVSNTMSFYAKKGGYDLVECLDGASGFNGSKFNLNTGTFTNQGTGVGSMISVGNGWYRCIVTVVTTGIRFYINNSSSYIGDGTSGIYLWGTQFETASYPTSYIPTVASTVTRNADVISKTGISSLIGQTEGTLFFDGIVNNIQNATSNILNTNKTPSTISSIALTKIKATNKIRFEQFLGNGTFVNIPLLSTNSFADGVRTKVAIRYKSGDFAMYINGNLEATNTSTYTNIGVKSELYLNDSGAIFAFQESVSFNSTQLYKTPLINSELQSLTTL